LQLFDKPIELPEDSYHGQEIIEVAKTIKDQYGDKYLNTEFNEQKIIGPTENAEFFKTFAKTYLLNIIKETLEKFRVHMDI